MFPNVDFILEHWDVHVEGKEKNGLRWRKAFTRIENRRFSRIKRIVHVVKAKILELGHDEVLIPMENFYFHKKSVTVLCDWLT